MAENIGLAAILQDKQFQDGLKRYEQGVSKMETATDKGARAMSRVWALAGGAVAVGAAALVAGIAGVLAISKQGLDALIAWGDQVNTLSDVLGTTGEQSSAWAVAMNIVGVSVDEGGAGLNFFVRSLDDYNKLMKEGKGDTSQFGKALKTLGVNAFDAKGKLRTFDELMPDLLDKFQKMPAGVNKSALAMELFGARAGTKFLDFLSQGSEGLEKARKLAQLYGLEISTDLSDAAEEFGFELNTMNLGLRGFWVQIGTKVLPVASKFVGFINTKFLPPFVEFARKIAPLLGDVLENVFNIFVDFIELVSGENKLPQFATNIGKLFSKFGLPGEKVTDFILNVAKFIRQAIPFVQRFIVWMGNLFAVIQQRDWGRVWKVLSRGVAQAWNFIQPVLAEMGMKFWDWLTKIALPLLQTKGAEVLGGLQRWIAQSGPIVLGKLNEWGSQFWNWLTLTALPALGTKGAAFLTGVGTWLAENGPKTWEQLKAWGSQFWTWLTDIVLPQVGEKVFPVVAAIASWLQTNWDSQIQPALAQWAVNFWDWLQGQGGILDQVASKMVTLSDALLKWTESDDTKKALRDIGHRIATTILDGIADLFSNQTGKALSVNAMTRLYFSLAQARQSIDKAVFNIGFELGVGMYNGIRDWFQKAGPALAAALYLWFTNGVNQFIQNIAVFAAQIVAALNAALAGFKIQLPPIQLPALPSLPAPAAAPAPAPAPSPGGGGGGTGPFKMESAVGAKAMLEVMRTQTRTMPARAMNAANMARAMSITINHYWSGQLGDKRDFEEIAARQSVIAVRKAFNTAGIPAG